MKIVILAEKPSQAKEYAQAMHKQTMKKGYLEIEDPLFPDGAVITYGFGHLVGLSLPNEYPEYEGSWSIEKLPYFPEPMKYRVDPEKKAQFEIVKKLVQEASTIIIATDSDREGELIAWLILNQAITDSKKKTIKRLWINSLEKEVIRKGFATLKDSKETYPNYLEAQTRQKSDWLVGMNLSPLYTLYLQKLGIRGTYPIGRVQTPTLMMVYQRNKEIESFKVTPYFELELQVKKDDQTFSARLKEPQKFNCETELAQFLKEKGAILGKQTVEVRRIEKSKKEKQSPPLFSLSALQIAMSKTYKASPKQTLQAVQTLYEKKWLTYPRTDTPYITENEMAYLKENRSHYQMVYDIKEALNYTESRSRYVNSKKVQEHHAIIPTRKVPTPQELKSLSSLEQQVYERVLRTTLAMFANPYQYEETKVDLNGQQLEFVAKGKVEIDKGWQRLLSEVREEKQEPEYTLPSLEENTKLQAELKQIQKETTSPKPYTEGTLIQAMKNAGKKIEDEKTKEILKEVEGIGTEATRADVLERLKKQAYMEIVKNQIVLTNKGKQLGQVLEEDKLLNSPEMTAVWEKDLKSISSGSLNQETFIKRIKHLIKQYIKQVPERMNQSRTALEKLQQQNEQVLTVGTCPLCGKAVKDKGKFYGCDGYRDEPSCTFSMSKVIAGKKLSEFQIKHLLREGQTSVLKGFTSKTGKSFDARLKLNEGKVQFDFSN